MIQTWKERVHYLCTMLLFVSHLLYVNCLRHFCDIWYCQPTVWFKKTHFVRFFSGNKNYRMCFKLKRFGVCKVKRVIVEQTQEDITELVYECMGPNHDFFQQDLTVADMGWTSLQIIQQDMFDDDDNSIKSFILQPKDKLIKMCE